MNEYDDFKKLVEENIDGLLKNTERDVADILGNRELLLSRKPFTRGGKIRRTIPKNSRSSLGGRVPASLSGIEMTTITQDQYYAELDPYMHSILFDENIPSICVKVADDNVMEIKDFKAAVSFQYTIMAKQTLHLAALPMKFTIAETNPSEYMQLLFVDFKHYWGLRNQEANKVAFVASAKSFGEAGLLYYMDRHNEIRSRLLSYDDGYVICSHNDDNGDRILETVMYDSGNGLVVDCWDDKNMYRFEQDEEGNTSLYVEPHGFGEIPLVTKRVNVAWDKGQHLIESYEILYNIFLVLQKKWGWGILYIKGDIDPKAKKLAGNIVLHDRSLNENSEAKFLDSPSPQNMIETLDLIHKRIQIHTGTTFILPDDIHTGADISGTAVDMTQLLDIQTAKNGVGEWQDVADKMTRLFKRGLAMEYVKNDKMTNAVTEFDKLNINATFVIWKPYSETEFNNMLVSMVNGGILSKRTGIESNTVSNPDEVERVIQETEKSNEPEEENDKYLTR